MAQGPEVAAFFDGAVSVETGAGWARPWRLPHEERALHGGALAAMAACAAVRLLLRTEGRRLRLVASVASVPGVDAAALAKVPALPLEYDLYVDGSFFATRQIGAADGAHEVEFGALPEGRKRVELWLPMGVPLDVHAIDCGGDAVERPVDDARPLFLCYGSSITQGSPVCATPSRTWPAVCSRLADVRLVNLGFGAECFLDQAVARAIRDAACDCIALEVGINIQCAAALTARTFPAAVTGFIQTVRDGHARTPIVVVSPIWSGPLEDRAPVAAPHFLSMAQLRRHLRGAVERLRARGDSNLHLREGLELLGAREHRLLSDGVHPCARGQQLMGRRFAELEFGARGRLLPGRCDAAAGAAPGAAAAAEAAPEAVALVGSYVCGEARGERSPVRIATVDGRLVATGLLPGGAPAALDVRDDLVFLRGSPGVWGRVAGDSITFADGTRWTRVGAVPPRPAGPRPQPADASGGGAGPVGEAGAVWAVRTEGREGLRYAIMPDGVGIRYELLGDSGPCAVLIPGGQSGVCDGQLAALAHLPRLSAVLQLRGFRVLLHDRRNTGASDAGYVAAAAATEAELQADDLFRLLEHLGVGPAVLVGVSSGGRLALLLARRHAPAVRALVLMNLTGGAVAAETLGREYYRRYVAAAESAEGMEAVCRAPHFRALCEANPGNRRRLEAMAAGDFATVMRASAAWLEASAGDPVLGHTREELGGVKHPAKVIFTMHQANCPMHTLKASGELHAALPGVVGPVAEWQSAESVAAGVLEFVSGLEPAPQGGAGGGGDT